MLYLLIDEKKLIGFSTKTLPSVAAGGVGLCCSTLCQITCSERNVQEVCFKKKPDVFLIFGNHPQA